MEIRIDIGALPLRDARREFERQYLGIQLSRFNGNVSNTARFVGMERSAFHRKIKDLSVKKPVTTSTPYGADEIAAILIAAMDSTDECLDRHLPS